MALSPREVKERTAERYKERLNAFEKRIDQMLADGDRNINWPSGILSDQVEELLRRYRVLGWKVTTISDVRDGTFIQFQE